MRFDWQFLYKGETGEKPEDTVYSLSLSPALNGGRGLSAVKAVCRAGYGCGEAPSDLAPACLELAAWNMSRYRGASPANRVLYRDDRERPGERQGRGTFRSLHAGECAITIGTVPEADNMTDKGLLGEIGLEINGKIE
jgi:hypothetical protein